MPEPVSNQSLLGAFPTLDRAMLAESQRSFATVLGRASGLETAKSDQERARGLAEQFLAQTFILPLLKQLRDTNDAAPPFAPTTGEKQLRALQDADLAQRIARATHFPLVDRVARDLLIRSGKDAAGRDALNELPGSIQPARPRRPPE